MSDKNNKSHKFNFSSFSSVRLWMKGQRKRTVNRHCYAQYENDNKISMYILEAETITYTPHYIEFNNFSVINENSSIANLLLPPFINVFYSEVHNGEREAIQQTDGMKLTYAGDWNSTYCKILRYVREYLVSRASNSCCGLCNEDSLADAYRPRHGHNHLWSHIYNNVQPPQLLNVAINWYPKMLARDALQLYLERRLL